MYLFSSPLRYLSPPQRQAMCYTDSKNGSCVVNSVSEMIARAQFPDANPNEDDLYGYLQYVTPLTTVKGTNATSLCTACNQQVANIFANYYTANPSPFSLNFEQNLSSDVLKNDLLYQYKSNCNAALGVSPTGVFQPTNVNEVSGGSGSGSGSGPGSDLKTPSFLGNNANGMMSGASWTMTGAVVAMAMVAALGIL